MVQKRLRPGRGRKEPFTQVPAIDQLTPQDGQHFRGERVLVQGVDGQCVEGGDEHDVRPYDLLLRVRRLLAVVVSSRLLVAVVLPRFVQQVDLLPQNVGLGYGRRLRAHLHHGECVTVRWTRRLLRAHKTKRRDETIFNFFFVFFFFPLFIFVFLPTPRRLPPRSRQGGRTKCN